LPPSFLPTTAATSDDTIKLKVDHQDTRTADARQGVPSTAKAPAATATSSEPAWSVDGDDVIRAATPELMERAALLMLLRQWGAVPDWPPKRPTDLVNTDLAALARKQRLELLQAPLSGRDVLKLDYPAVVMRKSDAPGQPPRPVVVSRTISGRVILLDPGAGFVSRPADAIDQELTGMVRLYWRPLNGWRWPGPVDGEDPVVRWLQSLLRDRRVYHGPIDGLVGPETEQALRRLAGQRGLIMTAADPLLDLLISQLLAPPGVPHLSLPDSDRSGGPAEKGVGRARTAGSPAG
jgi:hypothetical protein